MNSYDFNPSQRRIDDGSSRLVRKEQNSRLFCRSTSDPLGSVSGFNAKHLFGEAGTRLQASALAMFLTLAMGIDLTAQAELAASEFLSEHPEMLLSRSQSWGTLGLNTAAHDVHKPGEPLRIGTQTYTNGLGHHASGKLVVLLGAEFARFEAEVGLQPCASGSVIFRVSADGKTLFDSGVMRSGEAPKSVSVSVAGAQELVLEASDAGDGIACDMANWASARLIRSRAAREASTTAAVNIAPFAQVFTADPQRTNGATANRLQEFRADDVFLETELKANADGSYTLSPDENGMACIGLKWLGNRPLRELRLRLAERAKLSDPDAVRVQGWFGESPWQGNWWPLTGEKSSVRG